MSLREVGANRQPVIPNTANHQPEAGSGEVGAMGTQVAKPEDRKNMRREQKRRDADGL